MFCICFLQCLRACLWVGVVVDQFEQRCVAAFLIVKRSWLQFSNGFDWQVSVVRNWFPVVPVEKVMHHQQDVTREFVWCNKFMCWGAQFRLGWDFVISAHKIRCIAVGILARVVCGTALRWEKLTRPLVFSLLFVNVKKERRCFYQRLSDTAARVLARHLFFQALSNRLMPAITMMAQQWFLCLIWSVQCQHSVSI